MANRVWIELDVPSDKDNAMDICKSANQMLGKLVPGLGSPFCWCLLPQWTWMLLLRW